MESSTRTHPLSSFNQDTIESPLECVDPLRAIGAIEEEARALGLSELVSWAEQLRDAELHVLCGEPVAAPELLALQKRMAEFLPQDGREAAEVSG